MKRSLSRGEKWLLGFCGLALLGLGGIGWTRSVLEAEPDWDIPEPKPTPSPNGYDIYLAASAAIIPANPPIDAHEDRKLLSAPKQRAARYSLARRTAWITQNAKVWALFKRAQAADTMVPAMRGLQLSPDRSGSALGKLAKAKTTVANTAKLRGDWNGAVQEALDILEMGVKLRKGASCSSFFGSEIAGLLGNEVIYDVPAHLDAKEARHAARRLENLIAVRAPAVDILREEKWFGLSQMRDMMHQQPWRRADKWGENSLRQRVRYEFFSRREIFDSFNREADRNIAQIEQPYNSQDDGEPVTDNLVSQKFNTRFTYFKFMDLREETKLSQLLLRLTLRVYRLEKGTYPPNLKALTPIYLTKVPRDPWQWFIKG